MPESVGSHQLEAGGDDGGSVPLTLAFMSLQDFSKSDVSFDPKVAASKT